MFIDTREAELIKYIENKHVKQLPVGDIWIGVERDDIKKDDIKKDDIEEDAIEEKKDGYIVKEGALIIERKTIRDLEASILDGRYREQRGRILSFCHENKAQPVYILEGALSSLSGRLEKKALIKFINRLVFHYQISVLQSGSVLETADIVMSLYEQWTTDPSSVKRTTELVKITDGIHIQKKTNAMDPRQFAICCLAQCPGVSVKMADSIFTAFGSLKSIMDAPLNNIENIKVGSRKIGPIVAKRLKELLMYQVLAS
jgi:ERCC4-type nuclease